MEGIGVCEKYLIAQTWLYNLIVQQTFQYVTITRKSSFVLGSNDKFFKIFINICIPSASFILALINNVVPGKFGINYYMCSGEDPRNYEYLGKKVIYINKQD